ncbi:hypothetical protein AB0B40_29795 [Streptomyces sp. NPDC042638]|uniref:hypothetical protein n=1 Tax=Streptomyces sp. NPDC042638 TaxID=3154333 RepID=UPI0033C9AC42
MTSSELWSRATAERYDAEEAELSSTAALGPTLAFLAEIAGDGRAELGVPPLRFLPPGQIAVPFDVSAEHLGFDTFDLVEQILVSHHFTRDGDAGHYRRGTSRHRYAWPAELDLMARIAGLELERRVADWHGAPFTQDSAKHISVWRKPV